VSDHPTFDPGPILVPVYLHLPMQREASLPVTTYHRGAAEWAKTTIWTVRSDELSAVSNYVERCRRGRIDPDSVDTLVGRVDGRLLLCPMDACALTYVEGELAKQTLAAARLVCGTTSPGGSVAR